jgi:hypothetical protein
LPTIPEVLNEARVHIRPRDYAQADEN